MKIAMEHTKYLSEIGKLGGRSTSAAKRRAARKNAAKARKAHIAKYPPCAGPYQNGSHRWRDDGRCYSPQCREKYPQLRERKKGE